MSESYQALSNWKPLAKCATMKMKTSSTSKPLPHWSSAKPDQSQNGKTHYFLNSKTMQKTFEKFLNYAEIDSINTSFLCCASSIESPN